MLDDSNDDNDDDNDNDNDNDKDNDNDSGNDEGAEASSRADGKPQKRRNAAGQPAKGNESALSKCATSVMSARPFRKSTGLTEMMTKSQTMNLTVPTLLMTLTLMTIARNPPRNPGGNSGRATSSRLLILQISRLKLKGPQPEWISSAEICSA